MNKKKAQKKTILVIDDDKDSLVLIERILKKDGYHVETARSGTEGIKKVKTLRIDCILLDKNMPKMDGITVCKKIKSIWEKRYIPIILWTAANSKKEIIEGINAGADDFVTKTTDNDILKVRIQAMLRIKELHEGIQKDVLYLKNLIAFSKNINVTLLEKITRALNKNLAKIFGMKTYSVFLYDKNFNLLKLVAHNQKQLQKKNIIIDRRQKSIMWEAFDKKNRILIENFDKSKYKKKEKLHKDNFAVSFPLIINNDVIGILNLNNSKHEKIPGELIERATIPVDHLASAMSNSKSFKKLEDLSITDELTKLYNRRFLDKELNKELNRAMRYNRNLSCIMVDIDHFKLVNDNYGHPFGDFILMKMAMIFKSILRESDKIFRYGGEEFFIILHETSCSHGCKLAERIRLGVKEYNFYYKNSPLCLTISLGISFFPGDDIKCSLDMIKIADERLYMAKKLGRDRVISKD